MTYLAAASNPTVSSRCPYHSSCFCGDSPRSSSVMSWGSRASVCYDRHDQAAILLDQLTIKVHLYKLIIWITSVVWCIQHYWTFDSLWFDALWLGHNDSPTQTSWSTERAALNACRTQVLLWFPQSYWGNEL